MQAIPPFREALNGSIYTELSISYAKEAIRKLEDADFDYPWEKIIEI